MSQVSLTSLEGLLPVLKDMDVPSFFRVGHPDMECRIERRAGGLLSIDVAMQRIAVQTGQRPPWPTSYVGSYFWNFSDYGALQGSVELNGGNFTRTINPDGTLRPPASPMIGPESRARYAIQGVSLNGRELTYTSLLFPEQPDRHMLVGFLTHLGLTGRPRTFFSEGRQTHRALFYRRG